MHCPPRSGVNETFTVRKISNGVGVERIFPVHSPMIGDIVVVRRGRVRRAKLYYLRTLAGKATRIREKRSRVVVPGSEGERRGLTTRAERAPLEHDRARVAQTSGPLHRRRR